MQEAVPEMAQRRSQPTQKTPPSPTPLASVRSLSRGLPLAQNASRQLKVCRKADCGERKRTVAKVGSEVEAEEEDGGGENIRFR